MQYLTWVIYVLLSNKISVLPDVKNIFQHSISINIRNVIFVLEGNFKAGFHPGKFWIEQNVFDLVHAHFLIYIAKETCVMPSFNYFFFKNFTSKNIVQSSLIVQSQSKKCGICRYGNIISILLKCYLIFSTFIYNCYSNNKK